MKSLEICNKICAFPDLSLRLTKAEATQDLIADVTPSYESVSTVTQREAKAKVTSHRTASLPPSMNQRSLHVTTSIVVIEMIEVY